MNTYTEKELQYILDEKRGATELKAVALVLFMLVGGAAIGFLLAYGISYWGW